MNTNDTSTKPARIPTVQEIEANTRNAAWKKLTHSEQLADLDRRLGKGLGAVKQRARIAAAKNAPPEPKVKKTEVPAGKIHAKAKDRRAHEQTDRPSK